MHWKVRVSKNAMYKGPKGQALWKRVRTFQFALARLVVERTGNVAQVG